MSFSTDPIPAVNYINSIANFLAGRGYSVRIDALIVSYPMEEWTTNILVAARGDNTDAARISLYLGDEVEEQGMYAVVRDGYVDFKRGAAYTHDATGYNVSAARKTFRQGLHIVTGGHNDDVVSAGDMANIIVETMEMGGLAAEDLDF